MMHLDMSPTHRREVFESMSADRSARLTDEALETPGTMSVGWLARLARLDGRRRQDAIDELCRRFA